VAQNDDWSSGNVTSLSLSFAAAGAFSLPNPSKDSALVANFPPGEYGIQVTGNNGGTGTALVEIYEVIGTPRRPQYGRGPPRPTPTADHDRLASGRLYLHPHRRPQPAPAPGPPTSTGAVRSPAPTTRAPGVLTIPAGAGSGPAHVEPLPSINSNPSITATLSLQAGSGYVVRRAHRRHRDDHGGAGGRSNLDAASGGSAGPRPPSGTATILLNPSNTLALRQAWPSQS